MRQGLEGTQSALQEGRPNQSQIYGDLGGCSSHFTEGGGCVTEAREGQGAAPGPQGSVCGQAF